MSRGEKYSAEESKCPDHSLHFLPGVLRVTALAGLPRTSSFSELLVAIA